MKYDIGTMVKLSLSYRRNGTYAGKIGLVVDLDKYGNPVIKVGNEIKAFHYTRVVGVISV